MQRSRKFRGGAGEKRGRQIEEVMPTRCPVDSFTIGVKEVPTTEGQIDACVVKASMMHRGPKLGCGEQGCTFRLVEDPSHVIKVTQFKSEAAKMQWRDEACVGRELGALGVAPGIPKIFDCNNHGYIVMDILKDAKKLPDGTVIRERKSKTVIYDHMKRMPVNIQLGFVQALATMIDNGFIHMDNHIENLGFIGDRPVVFDFGFTQRRIFTNNTEKLYALSFSLFQMLEHCPVSELECGPIWDIATGVLQNTVQWNNWSAARGMTLEELKKVYPVDTDIQFIKNRGDEISIDFNDVVTGAICYAIVIQYKLPERYDDAKRYYDIIYQIRRNEYFKKLRR
jgi:tRNA A-37 threonylcarbamoyl transferase component Bud32